jgi:hypothetical protein
MALSYTAPGTESAVAGTGCGVDNADAVRPTTITFAFKFLQPTAVNQARLTSPTVPDGFSR